METNYFTEDDFIEAVDKELQSLNNGLELIASPTLTKEEEVLFILGFKFGATFALERVRDSLNR